MDLSVAASEGTRIVRQLKLKPLMPMSVIQHLGRVSAHKLTLVPN